MSHQPRRNFWTGRDDHTVRQRRRSDWLRQRYRLRPGIERLDPKFEPRPSRRRENPHRHSLGKLLARPRSPRPLRRDESQRRRPRRRRRSSPLFHRAKEHLHREMTSDERWSELCAAFEKSEWAQLLELCTRFEKEFPEHLYTRLLHVSALAGLKRFTEAEAILNEL